MRIASCALVVALLGSGCSSGASDTSVEKSTQGVDVSTYVLETLVNPASCMDARGSGTSDGTQLEEWACNGSSAQVFQIQSAASGGVTLVNPHASKCVDVNGAGTANGTKVQLWDCNGTGAQNFQIRDDGGGSVTFVNTNSGKCLDVSASNSANGTHVQLWDCNGTNAQAWRQVAVGGSSGDAGQASSDSGSSDSSVAIDSSAGDAGSSAGDSGPDAGGGPPPGASAWLIPMNAARAAVGEAPFTWDPIAAEVAQSWANQCTFGHNPQAGSEYDALGGAGGLGEDVAAGAPTQSVTDAVASWVNEEQYYDHATNSCAAGQVCGHYTQIVWKNSTAVGCAQTHCTQNTPFGAGFPNWDMSVCDFSPPGNYVGESPY